MSNQRQNRTRGQHFIIWSCGSILLVLQTNNEYTNNDILQTKQATISYHDTRGQRTTKKNTTKCLIRNMINYNHYLSLGHFGIRFHSTSLRLSIDTVDRRTWWKQGLQHQREAPLSYHIHPSTCPACHRTNACYHPSIALQPDWSSFRFIAGAPSFHRTLLALVNPIDSC